MIARKGGKNKEWGGKLSVNRGRRGREDSGDGSYCPQDRRTVPLSVERPFGQFLQSRKYLPPLSLAKRTKIGPKFWRKRRKCEPVTKNRLTGPIFVVGYKCERIVKRHGRKAMPPFLLEGERAAPPRGRFPVPYSGTGKDVSPRLKRRARLFNIVLFLSPVSEKGGKSNG